MGWIANLKGRVMSAELIFLADLARLAVSTILRRLWLPALTPLALPPLFLSLLVATIPDEPLALQRSHTEIYLDNLVKSIDGVLV